MITQETKIIKIEHGRFDDELLRPAADALHAGQLVAFPTETVYGLGANALDPQAVARIFAAKGRPGDNPLIVHIAALADLAPLVRELSPLAEQLFAAFSPGPITLVLRKSDAVPAKVTAGLDTVAVRIPAHPLARRLIELAGVPVAAPSANRSGRPSPTRAWHVMQDLAGRIPFIIDGGSCQFGLESTVVDATGAVPVILRPGAVTAAAIREVAGAVDGLTLDLNCGDETPRSPGMKYRHYAPKARVLIVAGDNTAELRDQVAELLAAGRRVGIFGSEAFVAALSGYPDEALPILTYGVQPDAATAGAALFDALRRLDREGVDTIIAEGLSDENIGAAYMNRLLKAAGATGGSDHGY